MMVELLCGLIIAVPAFACGVLVGWLLGLGRRFRIWRQALSVASLRSRYRTCGLTPCPYSSPDSSNRLKR